MIADYLKRLSLDQFVKIVVATDPLDFVAFSITHNNHSPFLLYVFNFLPKSYPIHFIKHYSISMLMQAILAIVLVKNFVFSLI